MSVKRDYAAISEQYIASVLDGSQLVCRTVRQAVDRHLRDLERSKTPEYPFYFDPEAGAKVCRLLAILRPSKRRLPIEVQPWQACMTSILYGWKRKEDGMRRFRIAFIMLPRKTGKSFILSGYSINALVADNELAAEVYSAALVEKQARRVFDEAVWMAEHTPELREKISKVGEQPCRALRVQKTGGVMSPLTRDKDSVQGTNPSFACADELHVWVGRGVWDDVRYGMEARDQPLLAAITTAPAADDNTSICNTQLNHAIKVLEEALEDDAFFAWITSLDPELKNSAGEVIAPADQWDDETKWIKACPNLGVTVKLSGMRQMALEAKQQPESLLAFQRYSLNMRVDAVDQAIATKDWRDCARPGDPMALRAETWEYFRKRICFAGLDLALTDDTSALVLLAPPMNESEKWRLMPFFFIPDDNIKRRVEKDRVPYDLWRDQGFLITTPGKTTDHDFIVAKIMEIKEHADMRELVYDPALARGLIKKVLTKGLIERRTIKFAQTYLNYAAPCGDFTRAVIRKEIQHDADPVLTWQITNLRWIKGHTGLIMPDKLKSIEKIDGAVACIEGYGRANHPDNAKLLQRAKVTVL
jgi:phage terminase large subunit-like protein